MEPPTTPRLSSGSPTWLEARVPGRPRSSAPPSVGLRGRGDLAPNEKRPGGSGSRPVFFKWRYEAFASPTT